VEIHLAGDEELAYTAAQGAGNSEKEWTGFLCAGDRLQNLPTGSCLDVRKGIFYWQPGPGFYGCYEFVFVISTGFDKQKTRVRLILTF
jgi:hypothetical protein